jgi:hypothetical protein
MICALPAVAYQQPQPPMLVEGIVYIDGERAEDGTTVEARIDDETVASLGTLTDGDQQGYYILRIDGGAGDEIVFTVDGEAADVFFEGGTSASLAYASGFQVADLVVGGTPETVTLTMVANGNGQTVPPEGTHSYPDGAEVRIGAVPDSGYQFDNWSGAVNDANSVATTIVLDGDQTVTANFSVIPFSTPTPAPTSDATDTPEPSPTPTPTTEPSATPGPGPTSTPGPSPTPGEAAEAGTPEPSPEASEAESSVSSETAESTPVAGGTGGSGTPGVAVTAAPSEVAEAETSGSEPTSGGEGDTAPEPVSSEPASAEEEPGGGGVSNLLIAAGALGVLGLVAVGFGIYGLRRQA